MFKSSMLSIIGTVLYLSVCSCGLSRDDSVTAAVSGLSAVHLLQEAKTLCASTNESIKLSESVTAHVDVIDVRTKECSQYRLDVNHARFGSSEYSGSIAIVRSTTDSGVVNGKLYFISSNGWHHEIVYKMVTYRKTGFLGNVEVDGQKYIL